MVGSEIVFLTKTRFNVQCLVPSPGGPAQAQAPQARTSGRMNCFYPSCYRTGSHVLLFEGCGEFWGGVCCRRTVAQTLNCCRPAVPVHSLSKPSTRTVLIIAVYASHHRRQPSPCPLKKIVCPSVYFFFAFRLVLPEHNSHATVGFAWKLPL